jgi:WD40 repeat protein
MSSQKAISKLAGHRVRIHRLAFTRDGRHMHSGSSDRLFTMWDPSSGECLRTFEGHSDELPGADLDIRADNLPNLPL